MGGARHATAPAPYGSGGVGGTLGVPTGRVGVGGGVGVLTGRLGDGSDGRGSVGDGPGPLGLTDEVAVGVAEPPPPLVRDVGDGAD